VWVAEAEPDGVRSSATVGSLTAASWMFEPSVEPIT
jgi:hypothetical protein